MANRILIALGTTSVLLGAAALIVSCSDDAQSKKPGNYVELEDGKCELRIVQQAPAGDVVVHPVSCSPMVKGLSMEYGFVAITTECGVLNFGPPALPTDVDAFLCVECDARPPHHPNCPFVGHPTLSLMRWERLD